jgi:hypothetical protein
MGHFADSAGTCSCLLLVKQEKKQHPFCCKSWIESLHEISTQFCTLNCKCCTATGLTWWTYNKIGDCAPAVGFETASKTLKLHWKSAGNMKPVELPSVLHMYQSHKFLWSSAEKNLL